MGGMSFKCPLCDDTWFLSLGTLRDHLNGKHQMKRVQFGNPGPHPTIERFESTVSKEATK